MSLNGVDAGVTTTIGRCNSTPLPTHFGPNETQKHIQTLLEIENEHLRQQISLLQFEMESRRIAVNKMLELLANAELRVKNLEHTVNSLEKSNKELAVQLELSQERLHFANNQAEAAQKFIAQYEYQALWLQSQLQAAVQEHNASSGIKRTADRVLKDSESEPYELDGIDPQSVSLALPPGQCIITAPTSLDIPLHVDENKNPEMSITLPSLAQSERHVSMVEGAGSLSPPTSQSGQEYKDGDDDDDDQCCEEETEGNECPGGSFRGNPDNPTEQQPKPQSVQSPLKRRKTTYADHPQFQEIKAAYRKVLHSQQASEGPVGRWVRTVMSNSSAIDTDPKKIDNMVMGLKELFEGNGLPLPLTRVGPCQYVLETRITHHAAPHTTPQHLAPKNTIFAPKLGLRLVNGRLMARGSGPSWIDMFAWIERQTLCTISSPLSL